MDVETKHMLLMAAKAAGILVDKNSNTGPIGNDGFSHCRMAISWGALLFWNPLNDDSDALRLAVKLNISICRYASMTSAVPDKTHSRITFDERDADSDAFSATRLAITRAAAAIGEAMP